MSYSSICVGLAQRSPLAVGDNLELFRADVSRTLAEHPDIGLLVYPEMHLHDASHLPESERNRALACAAVSLDSPYVRALGDIAREHNIWLIPGSVGEKTANGGYFNTELLFNPSGYLCASYHKMFPWRPHEPHDYGTSFVTHELKDARNGKENGRLGLSNCYDSWFPEHARQLAWLGALGIVNIVKTTSEDRAQELVLARSHAIANQFYVFSVNCAEPVGRGMSIAVGPEGEVLAQAGGEEETLVVTFDPSHVREVRARGTCGTNRMWAQFDPREPRIFLPAYNGYIDPARWDSEHLETTQN